MSKMSMLLKIIPLVPLRVLLPAKVFNKLVGVLPKRFTVPLATSIAEVEIYKDPTGLWNRLERGLDEVGYNKKKGSKYSSAEEEVEAALKEAPIFAPYKPYLLRWCERHRKEAGLLV